MRVMSFVIEYVWRSSRVAVDYLRIKDTLERMVARCREQSKVSEVLTNLGITPVCKGLFFHCRHDGKQAFFVSLAPEENN